MYQTEKVLIIAQYDTLPVSFIKSLSFHTEFKSFPLTILWSVSIWSAAELIMYLILKVAPMLCHLRGIFVSGIHSHTHTIPSDYTNLNAFSNWHAALMPWCTSRFISRWESNLWISAWAQRPEATCPVPYGRMEVRIPGGLQQRGPDKIGLRRVASKHDPFVLHSLSYVVWADWEEKLKLLSPGPGPSAPAAGNDN